VKISEITSMYAENTPLRIILTNILPVFGPSIDLALLSYADEIYKKRIEIALENLNSELNLLRITTLDKNFIKSESFFDIFRLYLEKSIRTRQKEKIQYYARLLTETIRIPETIEQTEQDIEKIASLSISDLLLMKHMYEKHSLDPELFGNPDEIVSGSKMIKVVPNNLPEIEHMNKLQIELSMNNLISKGLVREYSGSAGDYGGGWYFVTSLLMEIMRKLTR